MCLAVSYSPNANVIYKQKKWLRRLQLLTFDYFHFDIFYSIYQSVTIRQKKFNNSKKTKNNSKTKRITFV